MRNLRPLKATVRGPARWPRSRDGPWNNCSGITTFRQVQVVIRTRGWYVRVRLLIDNARLSDRMEQRWEGREIHTFAEASSPIGIDRRVFLNLERFVVERLDKFFLRVEYLTIVNDLRQVKYIRTQ